MKVLLIDGTLAACIVCTAISVSAARAQVGPLPVDQLDSAGHRHSPAPLGTPGEMRVDVELAADDGRDAIASGDPVYPVDALRAAVVTRARVWLDSLAAKPVHGLQLTPYGQLAVMGNQEALAEKEFAQRLATPGLSVADRAFVLNAGATALADRGHPEWLAAAERYVAQLTALGSQGADWQFTARDQLSEVYYELGQWLKALTHALRAYALLPELPFEDHGLAWNHTMHLRIVDVLLGAPGTPAESAKMRSVDSTITAAERAPADRIALDSAALWSGVAGARMVQADSAFAFTLGHPGPAIIGNAWVNASEPGPHEQRVDDGRIYLLDFFQADWAPTLPSQLSLERIQERFGTAVQVIGITSLTGHWGLEFVEPQDEIQRWQHFFGDELKLRFPVAFWVKPKERTEDGGMLSPSNPTVAAYHLPLRMGVLVVDQKGRVRRLFPSVGREQEDDIVKFVTMLEGEGSNASPPRAP
jgi:hypothetical protein